MQHHPQTVKKIKQRLGLVGLFGLSLLFLAGGLNLVWKGATHRGPGWWFYDGTELAQGGEVSGTDHWDKLSANRFRRNCYAYGAGALLIGGLFGWEATKQWRKRDADEAAWGKVLADPQNVQRIQANPYECADDFREWIEKTRPDVALWLHRPIN